MLNEKVNLYVCKVKEKYFFWLQVMSEMLKESMSFMWQKSVSVMTIVKTVLLMTFVTIIILISMLIVIITDIKKREKVLWIVVIEEKIIIIMMISEMLCELRVKVSL